MGRKAGLDTAQITTAAVDLVEAEGLEAASLSSVATRLGVKVPSLYNHISGLAGLRRLITLASVERLSGICQEAVRSATPAEKPGDELRALARAYRQFATDHPGLYRSLLPAPTPGDDAELEEAMIEPVATVARALEAINPDVQGHASSGDTIDLIRALRSLIHGFVDLEINGGFGLPVAIDGSFDRAVELFISSVRSPGFGGEIT